MPENALAVANYFIRRAAAEGKSLTPMQLQKLVYISHGWHLGFTNAPLIEEEVQAWKYGPVIPDLYQELKCYGNSPVPILNLGSRGVLRNEQGLAAFLDNVWRRYGHFSGMQLSTMTHEADTPWFTVWHSQGGKERFGAEIPNSLIGDHYREKIRNARS